MTSPKRVNMRRGLARVEEEGEEEERGWRGRGRRKERMARRDEGGLRVDGTGRDEKGRVDGRREGRAGGEGWRG